MSCKFIRERKILKSTITFQLFECVLLEWINEWINTMPFIIVYRSAVISKLENICMQVFKDTRFGIFMNKQTSLPLVTAFVHLSQCCLTLSWKILTKLYFCQLSINLFFAYSKKLIDFFRKSLKKSLCLLFRTSKPKY